MSYQQPPQGYQQGPPPRSTSLRFATVEALAWSTASLYLDQDVENDSDQFINTDTATLPKKAILPRATLLRDILPRAILPSSRWATPSKHHPSSSARAEIRQGMSHELSGRDVLLLLVRGEL
ncbi:hypothetical protein HAV15_005002 [Penicillium sp. str. |nr:hypothetical protein HAV15_005002 [Penicillium sp. str. \